jgi:DNA-binding MarR family transcriptional regulator
MAQDHVATVVSQWEKERPDLDPSPIAVIGRLSRLTRYIERQLEVNYKRYDLQGGTYDLLATLRRNGEPFTLTPTRLQAEMMLSSGATTHRIDLLEKRGLLERLPDPEDRRGTLVRLTDTGKKLVDEVTETHLATERELLTSLTKKQRRKLAELLGQLAQASGL